MAARHEDPYWSLRSLLCSCVVYYVLSLSSFVIATVLTNKLLCLSFASEAVNSGSITKIGSNHDFKIDIRSIPSRFSPLIGYGQKKTSRQIFVWKELTWWVSPF